MARSSTSRRSSKPALERPADAIFSRAPHTEILQCQRSGQSVQLTRTHGLEVARRRDVDDALARLPDPDIKWEPGDNMSMVNAPNEVNPTSDTHLLNLVLLHKQHLRMH